MANNSSYCVVELLLQGNINYNWDYSDKIIINYKITITEEFVIH